MDMPRVKKLYTFMLQTFIPQLCMTFLICLFILMMQFVFRYINDLVGKGLSLDMLAELFFYAALSFVPMALPLAILLASLMTFGNLGEHVELTALKSSGISLLRVMSPLFILIVAIAVGAFFFQNDVIPKTQVKMWTLLFSARQKSMSLDITEGTVNTQIPGFNIYVKHKDSNTDMLYDMIIYDVSSGISYPRIVSADSGKLSMTQDKKHILLKLYHGNWYEDLAQGNGGGTSDFGNEMYRRETYHDKDILIPYDATFTKMDDNLMKSQYIGKDMKELRHSIDSIRARLDSVGEQLGTEIIASPPCGTPSQRMKFNDTRATRAPVKPVAVKKTVDIDSLLRAIGPAEKRAIVSHALDAATSAMQETGFRAYTQADDFKNLRRHQIELQKKFTLSLACLIFFFIGAPLGAIIRKGGFGTPIVISVILFIIYYIIDNTGYKLARDGHWPVWQGIWLSSAVLLPLGVFLTYKAVNDSAVFHADAYRNFFRRLLGMHQTRKLQMKEVVINEVERSSALNRLAALKQSCLLFLRQYEGRQNYWNYLMYGYDKERLKALSRELEDTVDYLSNSRDQLVVNKCMDFPIIRHLLTYHLTDSKELGLAVALIFPIGLPLYFVGLHHQHTLKRDVQAAVKTCDQLVAIMTGVDDRHQQ